MAHAASVAGGVRGGTSSQIDGAAAVCRFVADVLNAEECSSIATALESDAADMQMHATVAFQVAERLCAIGGNPSVPPTELGAPAPPPSAPALNEEEQELLAKTLKGTLVAFYARFPALRAALRLKVASSLVSEVLRCQQIKASHMGLRLHALDGGARKAEITMLGAATALEVMTGMVRGLRKPPTSMQHLAQLREALLLLHVPNVMIDDRTPLLELFHKPLSLALVALVECDPAGATELLRSLISHWPSAAAANSSKEVPQRYSLDAIPYTLHPYTLHPTPLDSRPYTLHLTP